MVEVVFLGINDVGERIYEWLVDRDDADVLALLTEKDQLPTVRKLEPELIICGGFRHILPEEVVAVPDRGAVNMHKAYLPYNRGANPNVWSIVEDTPAGVSIHYVTEDIDAGPLIDRRQVEKRPGDTARDLYERLERAQFDQFKEVWPEIRDDEAETEPQEFDAEGTYHYKEDFVDLWELDRDETVRVGDLIDRLRATTFSPFKNAYFEEDGERYYVDLSISVAGEAEEGPSRKIPTYTEEEQP
jgi:methionyl-tRNA formyltransferase